MACAPGERRGTRRTGDRDAIDLVLLYIRGSLRRRQPARSLLLKKTKKESRMEAELSGLRTRPRLEFPRRVRQAIRNLGKIASPGASFFLSLKRGCLFPPSNSQLSSQSCAADRLLCSAWTFAASIRRIC